MKRLSYVILSLVVSIGLTGCGDPSIEFKKMAGDENKTDLPVIDPPCDQTNSCSCEITNTCTGTLVDGQDLFFQQPKDARVDILFIDDNSGSMVEEQINLSTKFRTFVQSLGDIDWQIAITTTDVSDGKHGKKGKAVELWSNPGKKILTDRFRNPAEVFEKTIQRQETIDCQNDPYECPSGVEQPLRASILAMEERNKGNSGFFRDGADLAIVILSDEDEMSTAPRSATKPQDVVDKFKSLWGTEKKLSTYGIIIEPGDQRCLDEQLTQSSGTAQYATYASELSNITGGVTGSICDNDYSDTLEKIGDRVKELTNSFELAHRPEAGTVRVSLTPSQNISWRVEGNKLIFASAPSLGTKVNVSYKYRK